MSSEERQAVEYERPDTALRDGIGEEDNPIPLWFNVGFYGLIGVGIVYLLYYTLSGWSAVGEYESEMAVATEAAEVVKAALPSENPYRGDADGIAAGSEVFATICVACHKADGSGMVGPSLVDPYWKYGNSDAELFETISAGRPAGMPPWAAQLGTEKIWQVLAYMETLPTTDEPGMGAPGVGPAGP
jgi:cytochrome c oxidase cbb3-type subunit 3